MKTLTTSDAETLTPDVKLETNEKRNRWLTFYGNKKKYLAFKTKERIAPKYAENEVPGAPPWKIISFCILVLVPSFIGLLYFTFIASDQFVAEARFAVRSVVDDGASASVDTGSVSMNASGQDAYIVTSFIQSSEILRRLDGEVDYRRIFQYDNVDYYSRFDAEGSQEEFLQYWSKHVSAYVDGPSGIVTISVRAFVPLDAVTLADALLNESEQLVNELSDRARSDMLAGFRKEVDRTNSLYRKSLTNLQSFQQEIGVFSPTAQAQQTGALLSDLLTRKLGIEDKLFVLQQSAGTDSPSYRQLALSRDSLNQQISELRGGLTGSEGSSLSNIMGKFTGLETDRMVAERLYESSRRNYDQALAASARKGVYLTIFVRPSLPEEALYPRRIASPLLIFIGLLVLWSTLLLAYASVEDHRH
ncbi:hypothetical protein [Agrobacterium bohemicum]|uniref:Capsule biosynthesis protein n=1 Tax=Agrobacterium bohemicum TaxID=2052828 RepID=A0A135P7P1_9HYPH|nr:hypothetical protein [Agrobacterium bohemicum]KXG87416.1 hypothetical protein ATO67_19070 [Agrobacterium bohemicum]